MIFATQQTADQLDDRKKLGLHTLWQVARRVAEGLLYPVVTHMESE